MTKSRIWGFGGRAPASAGRASKRDSGTLPGRRPGSARADPAEALLLMQQLRGIRPGLVLVDRFGGASHLYQRQHRACRWTATASRLLGSRFADLFVPADDDESGRRPLPFILAKQSAFEKIILCCGEGRRRALLVRLGMAAYSIPAGRFTGFRGSAMDVTEQRRTSEHASQLAKYDALTGLPNRRRMSEVLDAGLAGARASPEDLRGDADRPRPLQAGQRHPRPSGRGHPSEAGRGATVADRRRPGEGLPAWRRRVPDRPPQYREDRGIIGDMASDDHRQLCPSLIRSTAAGASSARRSESPSLRPTARRAPS